MWLFFWIAFLIVLFLIMFGVAMAIFSSTPIELTFLLGLVAFGLFANKLLFGYGWITSILDKVISKKEVQQEHLEDLRDKLQDKSIQSREVTEYLSFSALIMMMFKDLDYYKYAYYGIFMLLAILTVLTKFNLLGNLIVGKYLEGVFWGAATITFFVWGLEQLAKVSFVEFLSLKLKPELEKLQKPTPPEQPQPQEA
jgi:hypothetical protein